MMSAIRYALAVILAAAYQVVFNPLIQAAVIAICWSWTLGFAWSGAWLAMCLVAVLTGVHRKSRMIDGLTIFTARNGLQLLGDEQQGWTPAFLVAQWPRWVPLWFIAWSCCAWRNKLRNIAFWPPLAWLHKPKGDMRVRDWRKGKLLLSLTTRGWMQEAEYVYGQRFGDFGPRLDMPDQWGGVTWAFRPWGNG